jgi:uncharacterized protein
MGGQMIDYEALQQEALRGVVRAVLTGVAKSGLPGDHHFFISFDTGAPGVSMSKRLKEKYPTEMTIVLQHRFWDLQVTDERFEVKLSFDGIPERLVVPFGALKVFFDPSVRFGLQFDDPELMAAAYASSNGPDDETRSAASRPSAPRKPKAGKKPRLETAAAAADKPAAAPAPSPAKPALAPAPQPVTAAGTNGAAPAGTPEADNEGLKPVPASGAQIVSLDQFRKK